MKKKINAKDITNSPYVVAALLIIIIMIMIGLIVFFMSGIMATKLEITKTRAAYAKNIQDIATLQELRAENEKDEAELAAFNNILPDKAEDKYVTEEKIKGLCENFNLSLTAITEPAETAMATKETTFNFTVTGAYKDIVSFLQYVTTLPAIHRVDALNLSVADNGTVTAVITVAVLSQK